MPVKRTTTKKTTKAKIDLSKWENYGYWTNLVEDKQQEILHKFVEENGTACLGRKFSQRTLSLLIDPIDFAIEEQTPIGTVAVGVAGEIYKVHTKDGGIVWQAFVTKLGEVNSSSKTYFHYEWGDATFIEAIEAICDRLSGWMRVAFDELKRESGIKD